MSVLGKDSTIKVNTVTPNSTIITNNSDDIATNVELNTSWIYDIATHTMTYESYGESGSDDRRVVISDFNQSIKNSHLVFTDDEPIFDVFCAELDAGKDNISIEYRIVSNEYKSVWIREVGHTVVDDDRQCAFVVGRRFDITAEKSTNATADPKDRAQDQLTGLYHRERAKELITESLDNDKETSAAMILMDLDDFHNINDTYGKMYGDIVLQTIAGVIYTNFMNKDIVARIAGDQFMVFCRNIEEEKVKQLIADLHSRLKSNVPIRDNRTITISIGASYFPKDGNEFFQLYNKADVALYMAKSKGGDCFVEYDKSTMNKEIVGTTYRKMGRFSEEEVRLDKDANRVNKKLFDFAFDTLSKENNTTDAIVSILKEVCLHYGLDRSVINEFDEDRQVITNIVKWCKEDDGDDYTKDVTYNRYMWHEIEEIISEEQVIIFENARSGNLDFFREMLLLNKHAVSSIFLPVFTNGVLVSIVVVEAFEHHDFAPNEVATLKSLVNLISSYRLGQAAKQELETEVIINKNVMEAQRVIFYVVDEETHEIKYLSKRARQAFPHAQYGKKCFESLLGRTEHCPTCPIHECMGEDKVLETYDEVTDKWYTMSATRMKDSANDKDILVCITDVTDFLKRVKAEDTLTVADSYDNFVVTATKAIRKKEKSYAVICAGIMEFSKINDEYGYVVGDEILRRYAELMKAELVEGEFLCRIKGDDFAILVKKNEKIEEGGSLADYFERIKATLNEEFRAKYPSIEINCFAGAYELGENEEYINRCIDNALKARNLALANKNSTGGYYVYDREFEQKSREEENLRRVMKASLKNGGFKVYFQPKVDVNDGSVIGAEALVRLQGEDGKLVSPGLFIPLAEKDGMVLDIDNYVYEHTFEYMSKWRKEGKEVPLISVNVSRLHLIDDALPLRMKALVEKYELSPSDVELEITESVFFEDTERLINMIKSLKDIGFVISMDDFGSGYSTLNFMKELPVDVIKIDGGFFMRNAMDNKSKAIIAAIMQLTKNLEFESVSEGVETQEQVDFIREQGGRCVQGYFFYKPMPAEEFANLL